MFASCGSSNSGPTLTSIDISPISPTIAVSATQQFTATGHFSDKTTSDLTTNANWSSSVTTVATIQNLGTHPGLATSVAMGKTSITVSFAQASSSVNASTDLTVTP
jgi:hypothetical protein